MRILLADGDQILLDGLRCLLSGDASIQVVGSARDGPAAVRLSGELHPDVAVLECVLPDLSGIDVTRLITSRSDGVRVLALSSRSDPVTVRAMFSAGASGYLPKECGVAELRDALRAVAGGRTWHSSRLIGSSGGNGSPGDGGGLAGLTPREREVLRLVADGLTSRQIAERLRVSPKTVETHRANTMRKTRARSLAHLVKIAIRAGLSPL